MHSTARIRSRKPLMTKYTYWRFDCIVRLEPPIPFRAKMFQINNGKQHGNEDGREFARGSGREARRITTSLVQPRQLVRPVRGMDPNYTHPLFVPNYTHSHVIGWLNEWLTCVACNFFPFFLKNRSTCEVSFSFILRISTTHMDKLDQAEFGWIVFEKLRFQKCV